MITIAHLYPDELALYGENGNIKALTYLLDQEKIKHKVVLIDKDDKIEFTKYDFIYIGSGRKKCLEDVKKHLLPYKEEFLNYINEEKPMLVTGNALSIFSFLDLYEIKYYDNREVHDVEATTSLCKGIIKGFQNTEYLIDSTKNVLFNINAGVGNKNTLMEGFKYKNFYVTSIIGPILARNDNLCKYFLDLMKKE